MDTLNQISNDSTILNSGFYEQPQARGIPSQPFQSHDELRALGQAVDPISATVYGAHHQHHQHAQEPESSYGVSAYQENPSNWHFNSSIVQQQAVGRNSVLEQEPPADINGVLLSLQPNNCFSPLEWKREDVDADVHSIVEDSVKHETASTSPTTAPFLSHGTSATVSRRDTPQKTPSPVMQPSVASFPFAPKAVLRRDSTTSELANNFNTIQLQKVSSQHTSDEEVFKTPIVPNINLAARRQRIGPAALVNSRTVSTSGAPNRSPSSKTTSVLPSAVRRIKSAGNSLNVFNSRVQKSTSSAAQRSPLAMSFRDAGVMERINVYQDASMNAFHSQNGQQQHATCSSPENSINQNWATSPADSNNAPPLSASFTQNSYEENAWTSPPITPFFQNPYSNQMHGYEVPQSAPALITAFPNMS
ncbi:MAG: hypothetical protein ACRYGG_01085, partial [Janthinobacterium lividum]